jgi:hypothetical protein
MNEELNKPINQVNNPMQKLRLIIKSIANIQFTNRIVKPKKTNPFNTIPFATTAFRAFFWRVRIFFIALKF